MTFQVDFQRALRTKPERYADYYNKLGKSSRRSPQPAGPDWLVVITFVLITLTILFG